MFQSFGFRAISFRYGVSVFLHSPPPPTTATKNNNKIDNKSNANSGEYYLFIIGYSRFQWLRSKRCLCREKIIPNCSKWTAPKQSLDIDCFFFFYILSLRTLFIETRSLRSLFLVPIYDRLLLNSCFSIQSFLSDVFLSHSLTISSPMDPLTRSFTIIITIHIGCLLINRIRRDSNKDGEKRNRNSCLSCSSLFFLNSESIPYRIEHIFFITLRFVCSFSAMNREE